MKDLTLYFRTRLVQAWDDHAAGSAAVDDDLYVQWSAQSAGLQIECVSDRYLPEDRQLTFQQRRRLQEAGWQPPVGEDLPNYWQRFTDRSQLPAAVDALVDAVEVLRLGLPSSEPSAKPKPLPPVPTPQRQRPQRPRNECRTTVVVPVYKGSRKLVLWAAAALLDDLTWPVTVVDLLGLDDEELPPCRTVRGLGGAGLHTGEDVVVARPKQPLDSGLSTWLQNCADLLSVVEAAGERGRDVVVLAPWLLHPDLWLYAGVVGEIADRLVLCVASDGEGYAEQVALSLLDAASAPAPVVLVGDHVDSIGSLIARARAVLRFGNHGSYASPVSREAFRCLVREHLPLNAGVVDVVGEALAAPLWARFEMLVLGQVPRDVMADTALALLDDLVRLVRDAGAASIEDQALSLLHAVADRLYFWVASDADEATRRVSAVTAQLVEVGGECARIAERLRQAVGQQPSVARPPEARGVSGRHSNDDTEPLEAQMHYIEAGTTCHTKAQFAAVLAEWLEHPDRETTVGQPSSYAGKALVWIELDGQRFHLNGDSRDEGVRQYLDLVRREGPELRWHVVANSHGKVNKVAFGEPPAAVQYFYLYAKEEASAPYTV